MSAENKISVSVGGVEFAGQASAASVLIVDDSRAMRTLATGVLKSDGIAVETAEHGGEAVKILKERSMSNKKLFDLILLDMEMPVLDGCGFLKLIRSNEEWKDLAVIACTTLGDRKHILKVSQFGISGYILKPYTTSKLLEEVRKVLVGGKKLQKNSESAAATSSSALVANILDTIDSSLEEAVTANNHEDCPIASAVKDTVDTLRKDFC